MCPITSSREPPRAGGESDKKKHKKKRTRRKEPGARRFNNKIACQYSLECYLSSTDKILNNRLLY
jgi:hypothetical protein